jgi:hypothetical protein
MIASHAQQTHTPRQQGQPPMRVASPVLQVACSGSFVCRRVVEISVL